MRKCVFSLKSRVIQPSDSFEPRRKAAQLDEDYAWTPVLGVFDNFHEVGYFPTLFTFSLKCETPENPDFSKEG